MANFGKEDIGGSVTTINTDVGCPFAPFPAAGTITAITWHNQGLNTDTSPRGALYLGDGTTDPNGDALVQDFGQLTLNANNWSSVTGLSIAANAGDDFWFWIKCNGTGPDWSRSVNGDADLLGVSRVTTGMNTDETVAFPATIPGSGSLGGSRDMSVYITYTPTAVSSTAKIRKRRDLMGYAALAAPAVEIFGRIFARSQSGLMLPQGA